MSKSNEEQKRILLESLESGLNIVDACVLAGISKQTYYNWQEADCNFKVLCEQAQLKLKTECLDNIKRHSNKNWVASAWLLERKFSEEFSLKQELKHTGEVSHKISISDFKKSFAKVEGANGKRNSSKV